MNFFLFKTGLFEIEQDSLVFKGESPSATLEICPKIVHCSTKELSSTKAQS